MVWGHTGAQGQERVVGLHAPGDCVAVWGRTGARGQQWVVGLPALGEGLMVWRGLSPCLFQPLFDHQR